MFPSLTLDQFDMTAAGAHVTARGKVAIIPPPQGAVPKDRMAGVDGTVSVMAEGVGGLAQSLQKAGTIRPLISAMVIGFLGRFGLPVGADRYTSELVFTPDGRITANGQQLR